MTKFSSLLGVSVLFVALAPSCFAADAVPNPQRKAATNRYKPSTETFEHATDVTITQIATNQLSPAFLTLVKEIAHTCAKGASPEMIRTYAWTSAWHKQKKAPPSYLVDLTPLRNLQPLPGCSVSFLPCDQGQCTLLGYMPRLEPEGVAYLRSFSIPVVFWRVEPYMLNGQKTRATQLSLTSRKAPCPNGTVTKGYCTEGVFWRSNQLVPTQTAINQANKR